MDLQLTGKKALVTGSGKGIGRGIALALAKEGVHVAVNYQYNEDTAKETMAMLNQCGAKAVLLKGDVSSAEGCRQLVESAARQLGGLDILVNNAALQLNRRFEDCTEEYRQTCLDIGIASSTRFRIWRKAREGESYAFLPSMPKGRLASIRYMQCLKGQSKCWCGKRRSA